MCQKIDFEWVEREHYGHGYSDGYKDGYKDGRQSIGTKLIKYYDEDEQVWKVGEVIVDE